jgi:hypothetical protein
VRYYATYRSEAAPPLYMVVARLAQQLCDFSKTDLAPQDFGLPPAPA